MMDTVSTWRDRFLGRGTAAVTVPALDGALKPNSLLEEATVDVAMPEPDNLVWFGDAPLFSSGARIMRGEATVLDAGSPVTAMATSPDGSRLAVACEDGGLRLFDASLRAAGVVAKPLPCVTALTFADTDTLLACVGSAAHPAREWQHDLLNQGRSGALWRIDVAAGDTARIASGLAYPYGVLPDADGGFIVSESWAKRLVRLDARGKVVAQPLEDLPGFPARITPSARGGYWLCLFAPRSQLIEFVLREPAYRRVMMAEVEPRYWVAPALSSGTSFREPMQGGALKQMGLLKPWAPTRSYGLAVELDAAFLPLRSLHSRAGGRRHGITSALDHQGRLRLTSKGGDAVISLDSTPQAD
jgi:hypothetical protein